MSLVKIDMSRDDHKKMILDLCKKNKFYENDVYCELYRCVPPWIHSLLRVRGEEYLQTANQMIKKDLGPMSAGFFVVNESANTGGANGIGSDIIGFLIYSVNAAQFTSNLLFILVDKLHRNKGYGTALLRKYIEILDRDQLIGAVKVSGADSFYRKCMYNEYIGLIGSDYSRKREYKILYYIPDIVKNFMIAVKNIVGYYIR